MQELTADLFISLDGFAKGVDAEPFFGYAGPELDGWIRQALDEFHAIVMGRKTYEALAGFSATATDEMSVKMTATPKLVFSATLHEPPIWNNTRIVRGDLEDEIVRLKRGATGPIRTIGSLMLVKTLMQLGLVDRLRLMLFPVLLGSSGREPFSDGYPGIRLELLKTSTLDSRLTLLEYRPLPQ